MPTTTAARLTTIVQSWTCPLTPTMARARGESCLLASLRSRRGRSTSILSCHQRSLEVRRAHLCPLRARLSVPKCSHIVQILWLQAVSAVLILLSPSLAIVSSRDISLLIIRVYLEYVTLRAFVRSVVHLDVGYRALMRSWWIPS